MGTFQQIAKPLGIQEEAIRFLVSLLICFPLSLCLKSTLYRKRAAVKHLCFSCLTLALAFFNYGFDCIHFFISIVANFLILQIFGGSLPSVILSFVFNMGYLITAYVFTSTDGYDINWTTPQCIMTLRMIGLAFDVYDGSKPKEKQSKEQQQLCLNDKPSLLEVMSYALYIGGFFAGPQFPMRDYLDFIHERNAYTEVNMDGPAASTVPALKRFMLGVFYVVIGAVLVPMYGPVNLMSERFELGTFTMKCLYLGAFGLVFFWNYLGVWTITEATCIGSGFAYNGKDEKGNYKWDKLVGGDGLSLIKNQYFKGIIPYFNVTTNTWAARYIYKRCRFLGNRYLSQLMTLSFLAIWHGLYPGYFISFTFELMTVVPEMLMQDVVSKKIPFLRNIVESPSMQWPLYLFLRLHVFVFWGYALVPFIFLRWDRIYHIYSQVYFMGHVIYILWPFVYVLIILPYIKRITKKESKDSEVKSD